MIKVTSAEAQKRLGQLLDNVQREPVAITRRGRLVAFIVSPQDMEELNNARARRGKAVAEFEAWGKRAGKSATPATERLTEQEIARMVHDSR